MRGSVSMFSSGSKTVGTAGVAGLVCSDGRVLREVLPNYSGYHIQISRDCLVRRAQLIVGSISTDDRVDPIVDLRSPAGAAFCRIVATVFSEAEQLERFGVGPLVAANGNEIILTSRSRCSAAWDKAASCRARQWRRRANRRPCATPSGAARRTPSAALRAGGSIRNKPARPAARVQEALRKYTV